MKRSEKNRTIDLVCVGAGRITKSDLRDKIDFRFVSAVSIIVDSDLKGKSFLKAMVVFATKFRSGSPLRK